MSWIGGAFGIWFSLVLLIPAFFAVTDTVVRLDPKRKKVWLWHAKQPVAIDWHNLTPLLSYSVASAYATVKIHHGQYAEFDENGNIKYTGTTPHIFRVGPFSAAPEPVLAQMEYVRRYMEDGPGSVTPPKKKLSHKAKWTALINIIGLVDNWEDWRLHQGTPHEYPAPWTTTVFAVLLFPIWFPLQFTNWLALVVAPRPKWPKAFLERFNADSETSEWRKHAVTRISN